MSIITKKIEEEAHAAAEKAADGQVGSRLTRSITAAVLAVVDKHVFTGSSPAKKATARAKAAVKKVTTKKAKKK